MRIVFGVGAEGISDLSLNTVLAGAGLAGTAQGASAGGMAGTAYVAGAGGLVGKGHGPGMIVVV